MNVEILLDGSRIYRGYFDRHTSADMLIDGSGARELRVLVDNANGKTWWDWFTIRFEVTP